MGQFWGSLRSPVGWSRSELGELLLGDILEAEIVSPPAIDETLVLLVASTVIGPVGDAIQHTPRRFLLGTRTIHVAVDAAQADATAAAGIAISAASDATNALSAANNAVVSDNEEGVGNDTITNIIKLTQAQYDALTTPRSSTTLYVIEG